MTDRFEIFNQINEGLVNDAPNIDTVDNALTIRAQVQQEQQDLDWLLSHEPETQDQVPENFLTAQDEEIPVAQSDDAPWWRLIAADVGRGITEIPAQTWGGFVDGVDEIAVWAESISPDFLNGGIQITDPKTGNFDLKWLGAEEMRKLRENNATLLDVISTSEADSVTGNAVRNIAQFLGPFAAAGKVLKGANVLQGAGKVRTGARVMTQGAIADFLAFDGHEARLSDLIETIPGLQNPVTEFLASDENDSETVGRLKNAVEGLGAGILADGLIKSLRLMKRARAARAVRPGYVSKRIANTFKAVDDAEVLGEASPISILGDPDTKAPLWAKLKTIEDSVSDDVAPTSIVNDAKNFLESDNIEINWARIETPDDIKQIINDTAMTFAEEIDDARRGLRTNKQTIMSAEQQNAWDILLSRRSGEPLNAEQSVAARQLWVSAGEKLQDVARVASDNPNPENLFAFRRMFATFNAVQKEVIAARTETARALQSWAIPIGGTKEMMRDIQSVIDVSGGSSLAHNMAQRVAALSDHPDALAALSKFAEKGWGAKTLSSVQEYWINALLSNPKTHAVNALSNASVLLSSVVERKVASQINRLIGIESGVEIGEAAAQVNGLINGFGDALRNAAKAMRTGKTGFGVNKIEAGRVRSLSSSNWNLRSDSWAGRAIDGLGSIVNVPGKALQTADEFFKTLGYRMELHAQAYRQATRELSEGRLAPDQLKLRIAEIISDPPESIRMESAANAAYRTFTNAPGPFTRKISGILHQYPALRFLLPFINTPANILTYTFEHTPLAPLTARFRHAIAEGGAKADLAMSKMALGTAATMYSIDMGMRGNVTGSGPSSNSERQNWRRQGFQPYSIKVGDKWIAYNRLDPIGYLLGIGADIAEFTLNADASEETSAEIQEGVAAAVFSIAENMSSKSYMQGLSNLVEAISDPQRFGPNYIERFFASFVPSGVAEISRLNESTMKATHDITSAMKARIPGFSDDLPPRRDLWGRKISYESGLGKAYDAISPLYASQYDPEPIDQEMAKHGFFIGMPSKSLTIDGERIGLKNHPDIYSRYLELQGITKPEDFGADGVVDIYGNVTLLEALNNIVEGRSHLSEQYKLARDPEEKRDVINKVVRRYRRAARARLLEEYPELRQMALQKTKARMGTSFDQ